MPAQGATSSVSKSNVVLNTPGLPVSMEYGSVSWSVSFEGQPSGSLEYLGCTEQKLSSLKSAYDLKKKLKLYGIHFRVSSFSYQREGYVYKGSLKFSVYSVSVSLSGEYEEKIDREIKLKPLANAQGEVSVSAIAAAADVPYGGPAFKIKIGLDADADATSSLSSAVSSRCRLKGCYISYNTGVKLNSLGNGATWSFPDTDIITDGSNSLGKGGAYNDAVLTGGFSQPPEPNETGTPPGTPTFQYLGPDVKIVVEEDDLPLEPPPFSKTLRDLTSCFDLSGPKKVRKVTTQIYGQPDTEETWIYGFVFTAQQIGTVTGSGTKGNPLLSTNPAAYWQIVEYIKTTYVYTAPPSLSLQIFATDPTDFNKKYPVTIKKGYEQFASVPTGGGNVTFKSTVSYLTSIISQGWKLERYNKETDEGRQTFATTSPDYFTYQFFVLPTLSKTAYFLKSSRAQYGESVGAPFSVEWVNYKELSQTEKDKINASNQNSQGQVAVLTPDINYTEPMLVETETTSKSGFSYIINPLNPLKVLTTGEESYQQVKRVIVGANQYKEKSTEYSSRDPGFSTSLEQIRFKDVYGRPPEASTRMATAEQVKTLPPSTTTTETLKKYTVSTDGSAGLPSGGSLSYGDAETIKEAMTAIETELKIEEIQASTKTKTLTWFYPNIHDGDRVSVGADKYSGTWVVKSASWTLNYHGNKANLGSGVLVTTDGTQLTLGWLKSRSASYQVQNIPVPPDLSTLEGNVTTSFSGGAFELGEVFQNQPHRRNY